MVLILIYSESVLLADSPYQSLLETKCLSNHAFMHRILTTKNFRILKLNCSSKRLNMTITLTITRLCYTAVRKDKIHILIIVKIHVYNQTLICNKRYLLIKNKSHQGSLIAAIFNQLHFPPKLVCKSTICF